MNRNPFDIAVGDTFHDAKGGYAWTYEGTDWKFEKTYLVFKNHYHGWYRRSANQKTLERWFPELVGKRK